MRAQRHDLIVNVINELGYCTNEQISERLNIPLTTLRRDLDELDKLNLIERVYGGAKSLNRKMVGEQKFKLKLDDNVQAKEIIAKKALNCIKPGETIFIEAGSTNYQLVKLITKEMNLKIYTNSIENALLLSSNGILDINLIPGRLKNVTGAIVGVEAINFIHDFNFDVSFVGLNAIDEDFNYYTTDSDEAAVKKALIKNSNLAFALADTSKFGSISFVKFSSKDKLPVISEEN
jgi:DeoR family fructose operon transcriptional repressor